jgi:hypothetical protein
MDLGPNKRTIEKAWTDVQAFSPTQRQATRYSSEIASTGHSSSHTPQSMHFSGSIW